jgi:bile acid-coenzyme A ligase
LTQIASIMALAGQKGLPLSDILRFHADRDPDRPAVTIADRTITRRELDESSNRLARQFQAMGVGQDDFVTICLPNGIEVVEAAFAAWKCGATPHPISWRLPLIEAQAIVDLVNPALLVGGPDEIVAHQRIPAGFRPDPALSAESLPSAVATYWKAMSSGGSTGRPKVIVAHKDAAFDPMAPIQGQQVDGAILLPGPLYNNGPFMCTMLGLFVGNHAVLMPRFDEVEALELFARHKVDWTFIVPTMMNRIWRLGEDVRDRYDLGHLKVVLHSASICPVWLKQAWIDWLGPDRIYEGYGGTEGQGTTLITGSEWLEHQGSVGRCQPGARIQILDPDGNELPPGEVGEIFFLPDNPDTKSYHYIGAERREVGAAGSVGDLGWLDQDGWLFIADRRTDMIVTGGANVFPAEVEAALDAHPAIQSSIVIGLPHEDMIATVHAIVQCAPGHVAPGHDEMVAFLKTRIVPYKIPRSFELVTENLRDDAGKARRSQLREERIAKLAQPPG